MQATPAHLLRAHQQRTATPTALPNALVAGATGTLGNEVLRRLASGVHYGHVQVVASEPMAALLRTVRPLRVDGDDIAAWPATQGAETAVVMFDKPQLLKERERALWTPRPDQLPALARWLRKSGVTTLAVVLPHDQGRLPSALRAGLANLDEQALTTLGFERVLIIRAARKPGGPAAGAPVLARVAHWMLSNLHFMLPQAEQPVRPARVAELVALALRIAPAGIHVASPETVWQATQRDLQGTVVRWLGRLPETAAHKAPARN